MCVSGRLLAVGGGVASVSVCVLPSPSLVLLPSGSTWPSGPRGRSSLGSTPEPLAGFRRSLMPSDKEGKKGG